MLEGRQLVLLNIDEVIRIIRAADEPKAALIARFQLSDRQADDILEIRLRQLARLEAIKIEQELKTVKSQAQGQFTTQINGLQSSLSHLSSNVTAAKANPSGATLGAVTSSAKAVVTAGFKCAPLTSPRV